MNLREIQKDAINRGISRITDYLPTRAMPNPCWPGGVHPHAKTKVKTEEAGVRGTPRAKHTGARQRDSAADQPPQVCGATESVVET